MSKSKGDIPQEGYRKLLEERAKTSRVYKKFQLTGLLISQLLNDEKHKSLYIKLAKEENQQRMLELARDISERKNVENKGAYFMKVFQMINKSKPKANPPKMEKSKKQDAKSKPKNSNSQQ